MDTITLKRFFAAVAAATLAACLLAPAAQAADSAALHVARQLNQAFIEVASKVAPSVVVISVAHKPEFDRSQQQQNPFFEFLPKQFRDQLEKEMKEKKKATPAPRRNPVFDGQGSGIVMSEDGYILTNRHVVDGADKIKVAFVDGKEYDAQLRGIDTQSDIAVVKINATGLKPAKFADSDKVQVGEFAIAVGTPFRLDYTITIGHVSAKGRNRIIQDPAMQDQDFIQTDAPINPGNSGGPLVNIDGEVIGINTLIRGIGTGIGFAIPSSFAKDIGQRIIADGKVIRPWLGVSIQGLSENPEYRDLVRGVTDGVVVKEIDPTGPAAKADLKPFDVITSVDGKGVATTQQLRNWVRAKGIGKEITLDINRNGKNIKVRIKPEAWPTSEEVTSKR
jgi:S1-C subfamily serine protease